VQFDYGHSYLFEVLFPMENLDWLEKTKKLRAEGSFEKTMEHLQQVLTERPDDATVHLQIAWTHDALGKESHAVPSYEKAIELGLQGQDLKDAYLGLGSTYRNVAEYQKSKDIFLKAAAAFPDFRPFRVFLSLTLYNLKEHSKSMEILLKELLETTSDASIRDYHKALLFYSDKLDETFG
jgi:tetratricopeptide (TPR) repeat protein